MRQVLKNQYLPMKELLKVQNQKIKYLLRKTYQTNRFYHDLYKENNVDISKIRTQKDLVKLPIVSKSMLQKFSMQIANKNPYIQNMRHSGGIIRRTGGSTGIPLFVYFDPKAWDYSEAIYARSLFGAGYKPWEKLVISNPFAKPFGGLYEHLGLFRKEHIQMTSSLTKQIRQLKTLQQDYTLYSYPTLLRLYSLKMSKKFIRPNRIISTGELLSKENRRLIEKKMNCQVYNHYGSMEVNRIAWECTKKEGMHMDIDSLCIEFVKDNEQVDSDEMGRITITNLNNFAFPLIRYDQGDHGIISSNKCSCGRSLPLMGKLVGRDNDFITCSDGSKISPIIFDVSIGKYSEIVQYKLIQNSVLHFELQIVKGTNFTDRIEELLLEQFKDRLRSNEIKLKFIFVDKIQRSSGGKLRSIESRIE